MYRHRLAAATLMVAAAFVVYDSSLPAVALAQAGQPAQQRPNIPSGVLLEPLGTTGEAIYPAFEGWGPIKDGTNVLLVGYFNRNKEAVDVPIGPDNRIEPGGPDYGQPTHFHSGRQWGVFAIPLPKDFGTKKLTWTLTANGHTSSVQIWMNPPYWIEFFKNTANGNEPPRIKFAENGPEYIGPPREKSVQTLSATVGQPLTLTAWAADQPPTIKFGEGAEPAAAGGGAGRGGAATKKPAANEPPPAIIGNRVIASTPGAGPGGGAAAAAARNRGDIQVLWKKYRGPGEVKIADETINLENGGDPKKFVEAKTTATFSAPGVYWLRAQINDSSGNGGGGDQCCWTTAHVVVNVK
jgi:hypothetical protein